MARLRSLLRQAAKRKQQEQEKQKEQDDAVGGLARKAHASTIATPARQLPRGITEAFASLFDVDTPPAGGKWRWNARVEAWVEEDQIHEDAGWLQFEERVEQERIEHQQECLQIDLDVERLARKQHPRLWRTIRKLTHFEFEAFRLEWFERAIENPAGYDSDQVDDFKYSADLLRRLRDIRAMTPTPTVEPVEPEQPNQTEPIQRYRRKRPAVVAEPEPAPSLPDSDLEEPVRPAAASIDPQKPPEPPKPPPAFYGKSFGVGLQRKSLNAEMSDPRTGGYGR
jgi:hypothetical protein